MHPEESLHQNWLKVQTPTQKLLTTKKVPFIKRHDFIKMFRSSVSVHLFECDAHCFITY